MSLCEENETYGPKVGIKLTMDQANLIIMRHFPDLTVESMHHINHGYNNRVYIIRTSNNQEYILRLCGRFWTRYKTENEVVAILYISKHCKSIPVPKIYGYCADKNKSEVNAEYILMEKVYGESLENVWNHLELRDKKNIANQMAIICSKIKTITFPQIGSFQFEKDSLGEPIGFSEDNNNEALGFLKIGRGVEFDGGPFDSFIEYFKSTCETEVEHLKDCEFMKQSDGYSERLRRIEKFIDAFSNPETLPVGITKTAVENVPFVFTHGDLEPRNLLVNKETKEITGVLDWEFAGSYPVDEEWFTGFSFVDGDTSDWRVFNEQRPTSVDGNDHDERSSDPEMDNSLRQHFFEHMRKNGVAPPDDILGHMIRAELYYFKGFICPWWLREKRIPIPDTHYNDRKNACNNVDCILEKYGF